MSHTKKDNNNMKPQRTPWGLSQSINKIAPGIAFLSTAGHGGYRVSKRKADRYFTHAELKHAAIFYGGNYYWFEEDCAWVMVARAFPHLFEPSVREIAKGIYERFYAERIAS